MTVRHDYDVVIVGAGVAGGALAARLARDGLTVLVLERTRVHVDRIRGEWLAPWTPADTSFLGQYDTRAEFQSKRRALARWKRQHWFQMFQGP